MMLILFTQVGPMPSVSRRPATSFGSHRLTGRAAVQLAAAAMAGFSLCWPAAQTAAQAATTLGPGAASQWHIVPTPTLAPDNALSSLAVVGKGLAWAAGVEGYSSDGAAAGGPLILRWNGSRWSRSRLPGSWQGGMAAVAASSASNAWALGMNASAMKIAHLLHWNGHGWQSVALPNIGGSINADVNLAAAPSGRAWISTDTGAPSTELFTWNGLTWKAQSYPCAYWGCGIFQITARTGTDTWAVGNYVKTDGSGGPLALHWTGRSWATTAVPFVKFGYLTSVFAASATNAWAVGAVFGSSTMLLYHWDGTAWHRMRTPAGLTQPFAGESARITGDAAGHLWIYGFGMTMSNQASYLRYNGQSWSMTHDAPVAGQNRAIVRGVAVVPRTQAVWSVGVGILSAAPHGRARIELYGSLGQ